MDEFRFGKPVKICGTEYWVDMGIKEKQERRLVIMDRTAKLQKQLKEEESSPEAQLQTETKERFLDCCKEIIDLILGKGAYDSIFEGRVIFVSDVTALLNFLQAQLS